MLIPKFFPCARFRQRNYEFGATSRIRPGGDQDLVLQQEAIPEERGETDVEGRVKVLGQDWSRTEPVNKNNNNNNGN